MPVFGGGTREIDVILWEMAQTRHIGQSAALAKMVEEQLRAAVPMSPQPVQQAPFRVLVGANMPAVLVEMGYLTNADAGSAAPGRRVPGAHCQRAHRSGRAILRGASRRRRRQAAVATVARPERRDESARRGCSSPLAASC